MKYTKKIFPKFTFPKKFIGVVKIVISSSLQKYIHVI